MHYENTYTRTVLGQQPVRQAVTGMIALRVVYDRSNFQVPLGDVNVHVDAVVS